MNPVIHFELPYDDAQRIARFYESVFGWETKPLGAEMGNYVLAMTSNPSHAPARPGATPGAIDGGFFPRRVDWPAQHPTVVVGTQDIRESMRRIEMAGGEVYGEPMDIPGVGAYVAFHDTEGNRLSVLQPLPPQQ